MIISFFGALIALFTSGAITFFYFSRFYSNSYITLFLLCMATVIMSLVFVLPQKPFSRMISIFTPFLTVFCFLYNFVFSVAALVGVVALTILFRPKDKKRILFTDESLPVFITYRSAFSLRKALCRTGGFVSLLFIPLFIVSVFSLPTHGLWGIKAFPVDITQKEMFSTHAVPSGSVTCAIGYDNAAILINSFASLNTNEGLVPSPAQEAGMLVGDVIKTIDGQRAKVSDFLVKGPKNKATEFVIARLAENGEIEEHVFNITPVYSIDDDKYMIGITYYEAYMIGTYSTVQTVSFTYPEEGFFAATAHSTEMENDTEHYTHVLKSATVTGRDDGGLTVAPGKAMGEILHMNRYGTFGVWDKAEGELLPIAQKTQIRPGRATLLSSFEGDRVKEYTVYVTGTYRIDERDVICLKVKDKAILENGGIIRGMSGSPIIQNGKIIGALSNANSTGDEAYATFACDMAHEMYKIKGELWN